MSETRFWLIRHAIVEENARTILYGTMDVELCPHSLAAQAPMYAALARRLPRPATWLASPLSRTQRTAAAIFRAGYPEQPVTIEPGLIELAFGEWQGLVHAELPARLTQPAHAFWPLGGNERPPGGESMADGISRVGAVMERLAESHAGQDVVAVSHGGAIRAAVGACAAHRRRQRAASVGREHLADPAGPHAARLARGLRERVAGRLTAGGRFRRWSQPVLRYSSRPTRTRPDRETRRWPLLPRPAALPLRRCTRWRGGASPNWARWP